MNFSKNTPMIRQYLSIKTKYSDTILLYRMGDFYEMFFEDAKIASKVLKIALTSRNKKKTKSVPMCGFPYRAAHGYIAKLIENGHKVAICDQIGDASKNKGLVERKVVRVLTPGMLIDDALLDGKTNNFILALHYHNQMFGIAFLDISTGVFFTTESPCADDIVDEIMRISPSEVLISKFFSGKLKNPVFNRIISTYYITVAGNSSFNYEKSRLVLSNQFGSIFIRSLNCDDSLVGITAAGALIDYIKETQKQKLEHLKPIKTYFLDNFLIVDKGTRKNLELFNGIRSGSRKNTLISVLDNTVTSMGGRLLCNWMCYPLINKKQILRRQDAVFEALNNVEVRRKIRKILKSVFDLERLASKVSVGNANARDLTNLKHSIEILPEFFKVLSNFSSKSYKFTKNLNNLYDLAQLIHKSIREDSPLIVDAGGIICNGFDSELDELINIIKNTKGWINKLENEERKLTGISSLKVRFNKVFGYYIEVPKAQVRFVPDHYVCKQTLVNAERYTVDVLKELEAKIFNAETQRVVLEMSIFNDIRIKVKKCTRDIQMIAEFIGIVDCLTNFALIAHENDYCRPSINSKGLINIESGRHPVVEKLIDGECFVPNSIQMDNTQNQIIIITGPNMAGKSTILRQTALCVIMAHMGSFIPAKKASIPITDRIFTRVGALDNLVAGQSTFMVEMEETANILNNSTSNSLVIIDEIGRGTSTFDGLSIAWAIAEYLHDLDNVGVKAMFATHYHELTELERYKPRIKNFNITAKEIDEELIFMRKLIKGATNKSYGIQVARLAGIPNCVIDRSKEILCKISKKNINFNIMKNDIISTTISGDNKKKINKEYELFLNNAAEYRNIITMLLDADILKMNPIDALNYLNKLQIKAKIVS